MTGVITDAILDKKKNGTILEILRMSTEDGPGLRTTVFFKGCSLNCVWCHNPESISLKPQIQWLAANCIGCGICVKTCPEKALEKTKKGIIIKRSVCSGCGACVEECPTTAMELLGKKWSMTELADELVKDRVYFEQSGGGVTLSGGEAALQNDFCLALLKELKSRGIQTALDTCGQIPRTSLAEVLPYVDILLYDLKEIDTAKHKQFTGSGNEKILDNIIFAADYIKNHIPRKTFWIRTPVIPQATDTPENIRGIGDFINSRLHKTVSRWELCAFNNLCRDKYRRLEIDWPYAQTELQEKERMEELCMIAKGVVTTSIVCWSGTTKLKQDLNNNMTIKQSSSISVC
ncbi:MAG: glycyl-radical enzyme activating protein [Smithella sp.]|jgi:pyruvate formate lyase activating enzyme